MTFGKRQLVLAALVVALGAAVYLNWQFSGNDAVLTAAENSGSEKALGEAQLVNATTSSEIEELFPEFSSESSAESETDTEGWYDDARLSRQKSRDEAIELLEKILEDAGESGEAKKEAVERAAAIAQNVLRENNIESLLRAKGFGDCVVFIQNEECSVVVQRGKVENSAVVVKDIVSGQAGIAFDKIKVIENG